MKRKNEGSCGGGCRDCGFHTRSHAESDDSQNVMFKIASGCEKARKFGEVLSGKGRRITTPRSARAWKAWF